MRADVEHVVESVEETLRVAEELARALPGGSVVHLTGELGAGKTCFAKGLARGLGLDPDRVVSPTFTLVHEHPPAPGGLGLVHVDLYRLSGPDEALELGLDELPGPGAIAVVEWPERLAGRELAGAVEIVLRDLGGTRRAISIRRPGGPPPLAMAR